MTSGGWYQMKSFIEHFSGISMDALHILVGFGVFLIAAALLKRGIASPLPWLAVLLLEIGNEAYDLHIEIWPSPGKPARRGRQGHIVDHGPTNFANDSCTLEAWLAHPLRWKLPDFDMASRSQILVAVTGSTRLYNQGEACGEHGANCSGPQGIIDQTMQQDRA